MRTWVPSAAIFVCISLAGIGAFALLSKEGTGKELADHLDRELDKLLSEGLLRVSGSLDDEDLGSESTASALYLEFLESFFACLRSESDGEFDRFLHDKTTVSDRLLEALQHADHTLALLDKANVAPGNVAFFDVRKGFEDPAIDRVIDFLTCAQLLSTRARQCVDSGQHSMAWKIGLGLIVAADRLQSGGAAFEQLICSRIRSSGHMCLLYALGAWQPTVAQVSDAVRQLHRSDEVTTMGWARIRCSFIRAEVWFQDLLTFGSDVMLPAELTVLADLESEEIRKAWARWIDVFSICRRDWWSPGEAEEFVDLMKEAARYDLNRLSRWITVRTGVEIGALRVALLRDRIVTSGILRGCDLAGGSGPARLDYGGPAADGPSAMSLESLSALWDVSVDSESGRALLHWKPDKAHESLIDVPGVADFEVKILGR